MSAGVIQPEDPQRGRRLVLERAFPAREQTGERAQRQQAEHDEENRNEDAQRESLKGVALLFLEHELDEPCLRLLRVVRQARLAFAQSILGREHGDLGVSTSAFWGLRSYNFHAGYNLAFGISLSAERTFGAEASNALSLGLQADGFVLALPFLLIAGALQ